jgi:sigma-70-like protein
MRCKLRDPIAFRAFVLRYENAVFALLSRLVGHGPHVEDLAQEAFLRAYRAFPDFHIEGREAVDLAADDRDTSRPGRAQEAPRARRADRRGVSRRARLDPRE